MTVVDRERQLVELLDEDGAVVGACSVAEAHRAPGLRHRAFSVLLYDRDGRVLVQKRAASKTRFALRWSNTCCGHPAPGADITGAATARLYAELGLYARLEEVGVFRYQAGDPANRHAENEWDHVLVGTLDTATPHPDPDEVAEYAWAPPGRLLLSAMATPDSFTPWLPGVLRIATSIRRRQLR